MYSASFYGCPVIRSAVTVVSANSLVSGLLLHNRDLGVYEGLLQAWSLPSAGLWVAGVVLLYASRPVERRVGSHSLMVTLLSSSALALALHTGVSLAGRHPLSLPAGFAVHCLLACLLGQLMVSVRSPHAFTLCGVRISSHLLLLLLGVMVSLSSTTASLASVYGLIGCVTVHTLGPLPVPSVLVKGMLGLIHLLGAERAPQKLSGATLEVQQQQRVDLLEAVMVGLHGRQHHTAEQRSSQYTPSQAQVQMLTRMGFRPEQARQALTAANGDIMVAVQLLTT